MRARTVFAAAAGGPVLADAPKRCLRALAAEIDERRRHGCEAHASEPALIERSRLAASEIPWALDELERLQWAERCWMARSTPVWKLTDSGREAAGRAS